MARNEPAVNEEWNCDKGRFAFLYAGAHRLNGNGELTGLEWIREAGMLPATLEEALAESTRPISPEAGPRSRPSRRTLGNAPNPTPYAEGVTQREHDRCRNPSFNSIPTWCSRRNNAVICQTPSGYIWLCDSSPRVRLAAAPPRDPGLWNATPSA